MIKGLFFSYKKLICQCTSVLLLSAPRPIQLCRRFPSSGVSECRMIIVLFCNHWVEPPLIPTCNHCCHLGVEATTARSTYPDNRLVLYMYFLEKGPSCLTQHNNTFFSCSITSRGYSVRQYTNFLRCVSSLLAFPLTLKVG